MKNIITGVGTVMVSGFIIGGIKLYGNYKYYQGKCDANKTWRPIVEAQQKIIREKEKTN